MPNVQDPTPSGNLKILLEMLIKLLYSGNLSVDETSSCLNSVRGVRGVLGNFSFIVAEERYHAALSHFRVITVPFMYSLVHTTTGNMKLITCIYKDNTLQLPNTAQLFMRVVWDNTDFMENTEINSITLFSYPTQPSYLWELCEIT